MALKAALVATHFRECWSRLIRRCRARGWTVYVM